MENLVFTEIVIETHTDCTRNCRWCARTYKPRPSYRMPDSMFKAIVAELDDMCFDGLVSLYLYCEPLLDERLSRFVRMLRLACPSCRIDVSTNGDPLTREKAEALEKAGVNSIMLQAYGDAIPAGAENARRGCKIVGGGLRAESTLLNARGGAVPHLVTGHWIRGYCGNPFTQLVIDAWGKAWVCCNDYGGENSPGTFPEMSLAELWESESMVRLRTDLLRGFRRLPICQVCREGNPQ